VPDGTEKYSDIASVATKAFAQFIKETKIRIIQKKNLRTYGKLVAFKKTKILFLQKDD